MAKKEKLLRSILTAATVLLLVVLAWQCLDIYTSGNSPANLDGNGLHIQPVYQAENVITRLSSLRFWVLCYFTLLIAVCVMIPSGIRKEPALPMEPDNRLRLIKKKFTDLPEAARREETLRRGVKLGTGGVVAICCMMSLIFLLNRDNFTSWDLEMVMGRMLTHTIPWIIAAFAAIFGASIVCRSSMEREIRILKAFPGSNSQEEVFKPSVLFPMRIALYVFAVILIVTGIYNGGMRDVLVKAINICTECIGLG